MAVGLLFYCFPFCSLYTFFLFKTLSVHFFKKLLLMQFFHVFESKCTSFSYFGALLTYFDVCHYVQSSFPLICCIVLFFLWIILSDMLGVWMPDICMDFWGMKFSTETCRTQTQPTCAVYPLNTHTIGYGYCIVQKWTSKINLCPFLCLFREGR